MKPKIGVCAFVPVLAGALVLIVAAGCRSVDPGASFAARVDAAPPERRPKGWDQVKALMARSAPEVGQPAPDFTLPSLDGATEINRAAHQGDRPLVLIFASFT